MKIINKLCIFVSVLILSTAGNADSLGTTVAELRYLGIQNANFETPPADQFEVGGKAAEINGILGAKELDEDLLVFKARYENRDYDVFLSGSSQEQDTAELHALGFGFEYILNRKYTHLIYFEPGIFSDLEDIDADDFGLTFRYIAKTNNDAAWNYLFGIGAGREFGEPTVYPIIGAVFTPSDTQRLQITFPEVQYDRSLSQKWMLHGHVKPIGNQWNLENEGDNVPSGVGPDDSVFFIARAYELALGVSRNIHSDYWLEFQVGRLVNRSYEYESDDDFSAELDLEDANFAAISFKVRK